MKKITHLLLILITFSQVVKAQDAENKKYYPGLKASPMLCWFKVDQSNEARDRGYKIANDGVGLGFSYGAQLDVMFAENIGLNTEVLFANLRSSHTVTRTVLGNVTTYEYFNKISQVQVPIALRMGTNEINYFKYFGLFGFTPTFVTASKGDIKSTGYDTATKAQFSTNVEDRTTTKDYNRFNLYVRIGGGAQYNLNKNLNFIGSLTFNNGITDMYSKTVNGLDKSMFRIRSRFIALNLGIVF